MADVSEWAISTVSQAALERTINSFATALRAPFGVLLIASNYGSCTEIAIPARPYVTELKRLKALPNWL
jgi:hypothetical protein